MKGVGTTVQWNSHTIFSQRQISDPITELNVRKIKNFYNVSKNPFHKVGMTMA